MILRVIGFCLVIMNGFIRSVLTRDMARAVAASSIQTRLDFANSVLIGTYGSNINKLQRVLGRVVLQDDYNSPTLLLSELYWRPVNKRINFKIATFAYHQLSYLSSVLTRAT